MLKIRIYRKPDSKGIALLVNGHKRLAFNCWSIWRYEKRDRWGWLFQASLGLTSIGHGSAAYDNLPLWRKLFHLPNCLRRTLFIGWRTKGGKRPDKPLRLGYAGFNDTPYSFRG